MGNERKYKVIDCFTFYNELELLNLRLHELWDDVDYFVISESNHTHRGKKKKLYYLENQEKFIKFREKIIHVVDDKIYNTNDHPWKIENNQRNTLAKGIDSLNLKDSDQIIISDLDEIPNMERISKVLPISWINTLEMDFYYYSPYNKIRKKWTKSKVLNFGTYKNKFGSVPQKVRDSVDYKKIFNYRINRNYIKRAGWHFSYFGDEQFIKNKILNFAHSEYDDEKFYNKKNIQNSINNGIDLYGDNDIKIKKLKKLDLSKLPKNIDLII